MNLLNYRVSEKVITAAVIMSLLVNMSSTPVLADNEAASVSETVINQTPASIPDAEPLPVPAKATWFVTATAYTSDVWQNDSTPFLPANGVDYRKVFENEGAVNCIALNDLRLGAKVRFPDLHGNKIFTVCDRTNAKYTGTKRADFYFYEVDGNGKIDSKLALDAARVKAKQFGIKRKLKMEIVSFTPAPKVVNQSTNTVTMK